MKWIIIVVVGVIAWLLFRRLNREPKISAFTGDPVQPIPPPSAPPEYSLRTPMSFDDFYSRYYAKDNIDREFVRKILEYVAKSGGVPMEQLRPEDRLDALPRRFAYLGMKLVEKMVGGAMQSRANQEGIQMQPLHFNTVDDLIRQLEPHHVELLKTTLSH
ncbi:MAG TPA: hypothetical protein VF135_01070 [Terriglobales bacterium]